MKTPSDVGAGFGGRQLPLAGLPLPEVCPFHTENPREVRRKGLEIPAHREPVRDCDGEIVYRGLYRFSDADQLRTLGVLEGAR